MCISLNTCIAPSCAICVTPFMNCFLFIVSTGLTLAKCSGENVGIPSNLNFFEGLHKVSPIENIPGSNTPIISPAYASSTISLFSAINC